MILNTEKCRVLHLGRLNLLNVYKISNKDISIKILNIFSNNIHIQYTEMQKIFETFWERILKIKK